MKGCAFIFFGFDPDLAAMPLNDPLDQSQADAGAFELFLPMQPLKYTEEFIRVSHIETDAVVFD